MPVDLQELLANRQRREGRVDESLLGKKLEDIIPEAPKPIDVSDAESDVQQPEREEKSQDFVQPDPIVVKERPVSEPVVSSDTDEEIEKLKAALKKFKKEKSEYINEMAQLNTNLRQLQSKNDSLTRTINEDKVYISQLEEKQANQSTSLRVEYEDVRDTGLFTKSFILQDGLQLSRIRAHVYSALLKHGSVGGTFTFPGYDFLGNGVMNLENSYLTVDKRFLAYWLYISSTEKQAVYELVSKIKGSLIETVTKTVDRKVLEDLYVILAASLDSYDTLMKVVDFTPNYKDEHELKADITGMSVLVKNMDKRLDNLVAGNFKEVLYQLGAQNKVLKSIELYSTSAFSASTATLLDSLGMLKSRNYLAMMTRGDGASWNRYLSATEQGSSISYMRNAMNMFKDYGNLTLKKDEESRRTER